jgi:DNA-binding NarL/FixJ family response regulator
MTVRVLIVDDLEFIREGFRMVLDATPGVEVVGEAADGAAGVAEAERLRPDVVLMDIRMPALDGLEATRRIVALDGPPVRVLLLTTFDLGDYRGEALRAGASAVALKDTPPDELVAAVLAAAA